MAGLVIDASIVVDVLSREVPLTDELTSEPWHAPAFVDVEVASAIARMQRAGTIDPSAATRCIRHLDTLPIERHPLKQLLLEAWDLRDRLRMADAFYVALCRSLGTRLLTSDGRLARAVREHRLTEVVVLE